MAARPTIGEIRSVSDGEFLCFVFTPAPWLRARMGLAASELAPLELCRVREFLVRQETVLTGHSQLVEDLGAALHLCFGRMLERDGRFRGPGPMVCRSCGCHDGRACVTSAGPCYWVEPGLCSACRKPVPEEA